MASGEQLSGGSAPEIVTEADLGLNVNQDEISEYAEWAKGSAIAAQTEDCYAQVEHRETYLRPLES